jgi:hypothetical protein
VVARSFFYLFAASKFKRKLKNVGTMLLNSEAINISIFLIKQQND